MRSGLACRSITTTVSARAGLWKACTGELWHEHEGTAMEETPFELSRRETLIVVAGLMVGLSLAALDGTIVATALPTIVGDLGGLEHFSWVVTSYLLASTAATPLFGRLSDLYGRRRLFQVAIVIFIVGSMLAGVSQTMLQLILARGVQGVGGGGVMAMCFSIIGDVIPARERGRYMGFFTATFAAASVAGPLLGGFFVDELNWRWIFYINLPLGLVALVVTSSVLRRVPFHRQDHRIDFLGAALMVAAVSAIMLVAVWGGAEYAWRSPVILGLASAAVVLTVAFVIQERRVPEPILPLRLFGNSVAAVCFAMSFLLGAVMFAATSFLPLFLQIVTGASATNSGLLIVPLMAGLTIASIITGRRITATGRYRTYPIIGTALCTSGIALLSQMGTDTTRLYSSVSMAIVGYGVGMTMPTLSLAAQNAVSGRDLGVVTSATTFFRSLGGALGVALFGAVLTARTNAELDRQLPAGTLINRDTLLSSPREIRALPPELAGPVTDAIAEGVTAAFVAAVPVVAASFGLAWLLREVPLRETGNLTNTVAQTEPGLPLTEPPLV
jgi:EmrB/QacA subfamily drug resistance transporter